MDDEWTEVHYFWQAIEFEDEQRVRSMRDANPDLVTSFMTKAFHFEGALAHAVKVGASSIARILYEEYKAPTTACTNMPLSHMAARRGDWVVFHMFVRGGEPLFQLEEMLGVSGSCECGCKVTTTAPVCPLLHTAVRGGNLLIIQTVLELKPKSVKLEDRHEMTALYHAFEHEDALPIVKLLLKAGADVNHTIVEHTGGPESHMTPLRHLLFQRHCTPEVVKCLLDHGAVANVAAFKEVRLPVKTFAVLAEAEPGVARECGWTHLHAAAFAGDLAIFQALEAAELDQCFEARLRFLGAPIHVACAAQQLLVVHTLMTRSARRVDARMMDEATDLNLVEYLLHVGFEDRAQAITAVENGLRFCGTLSAHALEKQGLLLQAVLPPQDDEEARLLLRLAWDTGSSSVMNMVALHVPDQLLTAMAPHLLASSLFHYGKDHIENIVSLLSSQRPIDFNASLHGSETLMDQLVCGWAFCESDVHAELLLILLQRLDVHFDLKRLQRLVARDPEFPKFAHGAVRPDCQVNAVLLSQYHVSQRVFPLIRALIATKGCCFACETYCAIRSKGCGHVLLCLTCDPVYDHCPHCGSK